MSNNKTKKTFKAFAFLGKRGGVIIKKRFALSEGNRPENFFIALNGGQPLPISSFGGRWAIFEKFDKEITKEQAKKSICESLAM